MDFDSARQKLIDAAKAVAGDPSDENIATLLKASFDLPFGEMPAGFLESYPTKAVSMPISQIVFPKPPPLEPRTVVKHPWPWESAELENWD